MCKYKETAANVIQTHPKMREEKEIAKHKRNRNAFFLFKSI